MPLKNSGKKTRNGRFKLYLNNKGQFIFQDSKGKWWIYNYNKYFNDLKFY